MRREIAEGWTLNLEREDVCPVVDAAGRRRRSTTTSRRSARRSATRSGARSAAPRRSARSASTTRADPLADLETFIDLHQKKLGRRRPLPATRRAAPRAGCFFRRLFELHGADGPLRLAFLSVGGRRIAAGIHFETPDALPLLQRRRRPRRARPLAGRPDGRRATSQRALAAGVRRLDFLRGDEPYKYEWGAVDEPIQRLLVRRTERLT